MRGGGIFSKKERNALMRKESQIKRRKNRQGAIARKLENRTKNGSVLPVGNVYL